MNGFILLLIFSLLTVTGNGRDIYVATNGAGPLPYTNWGTAASNIEWAVNVGTNGDTVWISNGVYVLTNQITVISNITISGISTNNMPVVDGDNANRCINFTSASGTLANLFITRGKTNDRGGGVYMRSGTVRDCIFSNNISASNSGGGMFVDRGAGLIQRCVFIGNAALNGGGLFLFGNTNILINNCSFLTNIAFANAGGMYASNCVCAVITNCDFICNVATGFGGGAYVYSDTGNTNMVSHCTFSGNVSVSNTAGGLRIRGSDCVLSNSFASNNIARLEGGGVHVYYGQVKNCVIARNTSQTASGGGVYAYNSVLVQNCIIEGNGTLTAQDAGGVFMDSNNGVVRNCLIRNNFAGYGGGLRMYGNGSLLSSCTVVSNYASVRGGGIINIIGATWTGRVENCIIYFNECGTPAYSNYYTTSTDSSYSNCCVAPAITNATVTNNITDNPMFVDKDTGNYRLQANSPCVNAGVNRDWMTNAVDLDGRIRIRYGTVDMGAYEAIYKGTIYIGF